jgi:hypothetical protein
MVIKIQKILELKMENKKNEICSNCGIEYIPVYKKNKQRKDDDHVPGGDHVR